MARRSRSLAAEEFVLTDSAGEPRAVLRVKEDDSVSLDLADDTGRTRAMLGVLLDGAPGIYLYDSGGTVRSETSLGAGGLPRQILRDAMGQVRAKLTVLDDGAPALALLDRAGGPRAVLCLEEDGSPRLDLIDGLGNLRVTLTLLQDGISALSLLDKAGNARAGLTVTHEGSPRLNLRDQNAKIRAMLRVLDDGSPKLEFYASDGKSVVEGLAAESAQPAAKAPVEKLAQLSEGHLRKLPLRACVALAVRTARRLAPIFRPVHDDPGRTLRTDVLRSALTAAERVVMAGEVSPDEPLHYAKLALREIDAPALGSSVAGVVARAAFAAGAAGHSQADKVISETHKALSIAPQCANVGGADAGEYEAARRSVAAAIIADYKFLTGMHLGEFPQPGAAIDLTEAGPLGPLWPNGVPDWYQRLTKDEIP